MRSPAGERIVGTMWDADVLAARLNRQADILRANEGGVTFSGGEPLMQPDFLLAVIERLRNLHILLDTSGFASQAVFRRVVPRCQLIYFDLKLIDADAHRRYCGQTNAPILRNLRALSELGVPYVIRVPMIPGVTDTDDNLSAIARAVQGLDGLVRVDLLPYNRAAGGKYSACGMVFSPGFDESQPNNLNTAIFENAGLPVCVQ
jgi:pyruvate formate lyase activating enzyme